MQLTFNIIFVPETVKFLRLPILTLLEFSNFNFRLVANALPPKEDALLKSFCDSFDRLEYYSPAAPQMLKHGHILNHLFDQFTEPYFCFMDSDIFAFEPFGDLLTQNILSADVFSSCHLIGWDTNVVVPGYAGKNIITPTGLPLATTYLCTMKRDPIQKVIDATSVGFEPHHPQQHLPPIVQQLGLADDLASVKYLDTAKLLMILSSKFSVTYHYQPLPPLSHIGGLSSYIVREPWARRLRRKTLKLLNIPYTLTDHNLAKEIQRSQQKLKHSHKDPYENRTEEQITNALRAKAKRKRTARYLTQYMRHLFGDAPKPRLKLNDPNYHQSITSLQNAIDRVYNQYRDRL